MTRNRLLALIWLGPSAALVLLSALVYGHYHIEPPEPLHPDSQGSLLECLRAGLEQRAYAPPSALKSDHNETLVVRVYSEGKVRARIRARGGSLGLACQSAVGTMQAERTRNPAVFGTNGIAQIQVDRIVATGPLLASPGLLATMSLHPGLDGVGVRVGSESYYLLPSELVDSDMLVSNRPLSFVPDFVFGFDQAKAEKALRAISGYSETQWLGTPREFFRFRSEAFVEASAAAPHGLISLRRGLPPAPELSAESLREGAILGGRYLVAHLAQSGRYIYTSNLWTGRQSDPLSGSYSLPRHAGTTYFLAELYRITQDEFFLEPIERAIGHMADLVIKADCRGETDAGNSFVCVSDRGRATTDLGSTALAVVALAEYQRATGNDQFESLMRDMAEFLLYLQRDDGSFAHQYNLQTHKIDQEIELLYYSGEASLALARMYLVTGDKRYIEATAKALDWLVQWYDFFLGAFFYGEEHWTCIAAEAAYPALDKPEYWKFCEGYGRFLRSNQPEAGEFGEQQEWAGGYYFTPFLAPQNTPAGSRSEAVLSTYLLGQAHGAARPELLKQVLDAMRFVLTQQVRADGLYRVPSQVKGLGAIPVSPIGRSVRIDYVQHVCSAMIRSSEILAKGLDSGSHSPSGRID